MEEVAYFFRILAKAIACPIRVAKPNLRERLAVLPLKATRLVRQKDTRCIVQALPDKLLAKDAVAFLVRGLSEFWEHWKVRLIDLHWLR
jgi:hypothetical protein